MDSILGDYYGIDWLTLMLGVSASYLISNAGRLYTGLCVGLLACSGGMSVAVMSDQYGFIVYNGILMCLNLRGLYLGWRKNQITQQTSDAQAHARVQSTAANDQARARDPYRSEPALAA